MLHIFSLIFATVLLFSSCASLNKEFDRAALEKNDEFDKLVKIEPDPSAVKDEKADGNLVEAVDLKQPEENLDKKISKVLQPETQQPKIARPVQKKEKPSPDAAVKAVKAKEASPQAKVRQPTIEDAEGFDGRRPLEEPFRIGEEVVLGISYFGIEAGKFTMKVEPMVQINGKKSYHFKYVIKTSPLFNMVYRVDDVAETFVDYENWVPYSYEIHVNESKQIRETRTFFDHKKNTAIMWDRKQKPDGKIEKEKLNWKIEPFAQNVFSAPYYLRNFQLEVGKKLQVHVGHEGKNILMTAEVLRRETIYTPVGAFDTFVVKPSFDVDGKFKPTGENFLWLTADERKFIVRLESKIKIGTIVGGLQKLKKQ